MILESSRARFLEQLSHCGICPLRGFDGRMMDGFTAYFTGIWAKS